MSRVGKNPVSIPQGVTVDVAGGTATVKGKLGTLKLPIAANVDVSVKDGKVWVKPLSETQQARIMWGTTRANLRNMVDGVSKGFSKSLEINGVGYRAAVQGKNLQLQMGYSHDVLYPIPEGITIKCEKPTAMTISGSIPDPRGSRIHAATRPDGNASAPSCACVQPAPSRRNPHRNQTQTRSPPRSANSFYLPPFLQPDVLCGAYRVLIETVLDFHVFDKHQHD